MTHHSSADPAQYHAWSNHRARDARRHVPMARLGVLAFWALIAGLLAARILIADPNRSEASASPQQSRTSTSVR